DACKTAFDNSKGMLALLAMLKTVADKCYFASCQSFKKLKVLYLQPSGKKCIFTLSSCASFIN
ncbi:hypothetical protein EDC96DRAFT_525209, partial [Choanephora cucurbitarum]